MSDYWQILWTLKLLICGQRPTSTTNINEHCQQYIVISSNAEKADVQYLQRIDRNGQMLNIDLTHVEKKADFECFLATENLNATTKRTFVYTTITFAPLQYGRLLNME